MTCSPSSFRARTFKAIYRLYQRRQGEGLSAEEEQNFNRLLLERSYAAIRERGAMRNITELVDIELWKEKVQGFLVSFAWEMLGFFGNSLLAILFSFLIVFDYARLSGEVKGLASSKLRDFFVEASQPVMKFAVSVGEGFQALVTIAFITNLL